MRVGVPKEIKKNEHRVGLTPTAVREYVARGHQVSVQTGAGLGAGFADDAFVKAGATIVADAPTIFANSDMIVKVKEPQKVEWEMLREDQILYTYLHLAPDPEQTADLVKSGVTAIAYETVTGPGNTLPLLKPMSQVAGRMSIQAGATALQKAHGGRGVLLGGVPGVLPGKVLVIGGGVVGFHAAQMAVVMVADVTILDRDPEVLERLDNHFEGRAKTRFSNLAVVQQMVQEAELVI
ncbi:MAG: alanine dehydrogenase, partial [Brevundimonas sp.]